MQIKRFESTIRRLISTSRDFERFRDPHLAGNPFAGYLKIFEKQHRIIHILYRGLIFSFTMLLMVVSFTIYSYMDFLEHSSWGLYLLGAVDFVLVLGILRAIFALQRYRERSDGILDQIYKHLKDDVHSIERIKRDQEMMAQTQTQLKRRLRRMKENQEPFLAEHYAGWDRKLCPHCNSWIEMTKDQCPICYQFLSKTLGN